MNGLPLKVLGHSYRISRECSCKFGRTVFISQSRRSGGRVVETIFFIFFFRATVIEFRHQLLYQRIRSRFCFHHHKLIPLFDYRDYV